MQIGNFIGVSVIVLSLIIPILLVNKFVKTRTKKIFLSIFISLLTLIIMSSSSVSIENLIFKFDTPESVFYFNHSKEIIDVIEGNSSTMIVYKENKNTTGLYFAKKTDKGYKLPNILITSKRIKNIFYENGVLSIYNVIGTDDYYISGFATLIKENSNILNDDNEIVKGIVTDVNNLKQISFHDYIGNYETDDYYLIINDEKIMISEKTQSDNSLVTTESR